MMKKKFRKYVLLTTFLPSAFLFSSSCSSSVEVENKEITEDIKNFLKTKPNKSITSITDIQEVKKYPVKLYIDNSEMTIKTFKVSDELDEILKKDSNISLEFNFSEAQPDGDKLKFDLVFLRNNEIIIEDSCIIEGFITRTEYSSKSKNYLQSLNLNSSLRNKYELKEFLETKLPEPNQPNEWEQLLDFNIPPGHKIELNNDIQSSKYDYQNQKIIIGSFTSSISFAGEEQKEDLAISISNNFINPTKPLSIFLVDDNGVDTTILKENDISSEVVFIDRTTDKKIRFDNNKTFNTAAIYGELDLSHFNDWELPTNTNFGFFETNFITSIKLPLNVVEVPSRLFLNNKIEFFETNNKITKISNDSFDANVKYGKNLIEQLGLNLYYDFNNKTLNFANQSSITTIETIEKLLDLLNLVVRKDNSLEIQKIILPGEILFATNNNTNNNIININNLSIKINEVAIVSSEKINIHDDLSFGKWEINNLIINPEIISINMRKIKKTNRIINRTLHQSIIDLVQNGVLDLRDENNINNLLNYNKNLNNYFDVGDPSKNIINSLYLENLEDPTSSDFENIFQNLESQKNKIYISSKTVFLSLPINIDPKIEIIRETPENLTGLIISGHLNLENSPDIFVKDFYKNIIHIKNINKITFPNSITEIPSRAFYNIDLSNIVINFNPNLEIIGDEAFYNSRLNQNNLLPSINLPNVTSIGTRAFENNFLSSINLPNATLIGTHAFQNNKLQEIQLPNIETISSYSFSNNSLTNIYLPKTKLINNGAFLSNKLTTINLPIIEKICYLAFNSNEIEKISLNLKTSIKNNSFDENVQKEIKIEDQKELIEGLYIDSVNKPGKKTIDFSKVLLTNNTFLEAINQLNFQIKSGDTIHEIIWNLDLLSPPSSTKLNTLINVKSIEKLTIQKSNNGYDKIPDNLFRDIKINEVVGLENVTYIGAYAFYNSNIQIFNGIQGDLILKNNLEFLGIRSFWGNSIKKLTIQSGAKFQIYSGTFLQNPLELVTIPNTIEFLDSNAFDNNVWGKIDRAPYKSELSSDQTNEWVFYEETGLIIFNKNILGSEFIENNIKRLNGLKIKEIRFDESIYLIKENFLKNFKNNGSIIEVDLSSILVIEENAFSPSNNFKIKSGTSGNILYNHINSGIS